MLDAMRRLVILALLLLPGLALAAPPQRPLGSYNDPLLFGMTYDEVARIVDAPLVYLSGRRGSERYMVERMSSVPGSPSGGRSSRLRRRC